MEGHMGAVNALVVLRDGLIASGSDDGTLRLWDTDTATCLAILKCGGGPILVLALLDNCRIASGSSDGTIRLWDPSHPDHPPSLVFCDRVVFTSMVWMHSQKILVVGDQLGRLHWLGAGESACVHSMAKQEISQNHKKERLDIGLDYSDSLKISSLFLEPEYEEPCRLPPKRRIMRLVEMAKIESLRIGHIATGPEHIMLAILGERSCKTFKVLNELDITITAARQKALELFGREGALISDKACLSPLAEEMTTHVAESYIDCSPEMNPVDAISLLLLDSVQGPAYTLLESLLVDTENLKSLIAKPAPCIPRELDMHSKRGANVPAGRRLIRLAEFAKVESLRLGHAVAGTEHLMLAILGEKSSKLSIALNALGINLKDARLKAVAIFGRGDASPSGTASLSPKAEDILGHANHLLRVSENDPFEIVASLLIEGENNAACALLKSLSVDISALQKSLSD
jgi:hypothetical protein